MIPDDKKIIYVTREIERAIGMTPSANYQIASNRTPFGEKIQKQYPDYITLVNSPSGKLLGTGELVETPEVRQLLARTANCSILVFKNTLRVEAIVKASGVNCLNPQSVLSERVENKLSQIRWLGPLAAKYLPPHGAKLAKYITWKGHDPFILQWAHGHTGDGTILISTPEELKAIQEKFPERMARVSPFIVGSSFTVNAVVTPTRVIMGNINYQITGLEPFTDNHFSTVGNDWGLIRNILTAEEITKIGSMVSDIGTRLAADGWKGLFGVDIIRDDINKRLYLIEVNARQPAGAVFESALQNEARANGKRGLTTFEAHIRALLDLPIDEDIITIEDGAQIIQRVTKNVQSIFDDVGEKLTKAGFDFISYENSTPNTDLLRIQSSSGIMSGHALFNEKGQKIIEIIKDSHFKIQI
ncbi:MAG: ATP-grasp domain-containing protein [Candidatus Paceibacterota bacterium]|jgi:hypothetical protein